MNCKEGTEIVLSQIMEVLDGLENEIYRQPLPIFSGSTFGNHFRHILDFYTCLIKGVSVGLIDYDQRERNPLIETNIEIAKDAFDDILKAISALNEEDNIALKADFTPKSIERPTVKSSIGRELLYAYDHAIHHLAMIKMGIRASFPQVKVSKNIGIAPSTIKHWQNN